MVIHLDAYRFVCRFSLDPIINDRYGENFNCTPAQCDTATLPSIRYGCAFGRKSVRYVCVCEFMRIQFVENVRVICL